MVLRRGVLPAWRYEVAKQQIEIQQRGILFELWKRRREIAQRPFTEEDGEYIRQLEIQLAQVAKSLQDLNASPRKKKWTLYDRLRLRIWEWAVRERFDGAEE